MFQNLEVFRTSMAMARHAGLKQAITAQNVANADTPRYRALSVQDFAEFMPSRSADAGSGMKATRSNHIGSSARSERVQPRADSAVEPNGNGTSIEEQILHSVDAKRQHDRALAIYRSSLGLLRSALSKQ